jgi:hypothetical protein
LTGQLLSSCLIGWLLFLFHGLPAAGDGAAASLGDNHFRAALGAAVSLADLISHITPPLCESQLPYIICRNDDYCQSWRRHFVIIIWGTSGSHMQSVPSAPRFFIFSHPCRPRIICGLARSLAPGLILYFVHKSL